MTAQAQPFYTAEDLEPVVAQLRANYSQKTDSASVVVDGYHLLVMKVDRHDDYYTWQVTNFNVQNPYSMGQSTTLTLDGGMRTLAAAHLHILSRLKMKAEQAAVATAA